MGTQAFWTTLTGRTKKRHSLEYDIVRWSPRSPNCSWHCLTDFRRMTFLFGECINHDLWFLFWFFMILFADSEALREKRILVSVETVPLGTVAGKANINLSWRQRGCVVLWAIDLEHWRPCCGRKRNRLCMLWPSLLNFQGKPRFDSCFWSAIQYIRLI